MRISEFARQAGVSPRALRHYEEAGLLIPDRTSAVYRDYTPDQFATVAHIRVMLDAGLNVDVIRRYLDCVATSEDALTIELCPGLQQALDTVDERLNEHAARIALTRTGLRRFVAATGTPDSKTTVPCPANTQPA